MSEETFWNGLPCPCRKVTVIVADSGQFPLYWAKGEGILGQRIDAVEVEPDSVEAIA